MGEHVIRGQHGIQRDSDAWLFSVKVCFAIALLSTGAGTAVLPVSLWVKGFVGMGLLFCIGSAFTLAKTLRDAHEADKIINRISEARAEEMLSRRDGNGERHAHAE
jgi:hypothetical protein